MPTIQHTTNVAVCRVFDQSKLPKYEAMQHQLYNLDNFLNIKCGNNNDIKALFLRHIARSEFYKDIFKSDCGMEWNFAVYFLCHWDIVMRKDWKDCMLFAMIVEGRI